MCRLRQKTQLGGFIFLILMRMWGRWSNLTMTCFRWVEPKMQRIGRSAWSCGIAGPRILTWNYSTVYRFTPDLFAPCFASGKNKPFAVPSLWAGRKRRRTTNTPRKRYLIDLPKAFHVQLNLDDTEVESRRWWNLSVWYSELRWKWWNFHSCGRIRSAALFSGWALPASSVALASLHFLQSTVPLQILLSETHPFPGPPVKAACVYSDLAGQKIPRT